MFSFMDLNNSVIVNAGTSQLGDVNLHRRSVNIAMKLTVSIENEVNGSLLCFSYVSNNSQPLPEYHWRGCMYIITQ